MLFSPLARQMCIAVAPQLAAMSLGGCVGFPCILLQQFKSKESTIRPDLDTMTWITSVDGLTGLGGIIASSVMQAKGRKFAFTCCCLLMIIGWLLLFIANNVYIVILALAFLGFGSSCTVIVNLTTVSEMLAPKYRTPTMMFLGINQSVGFVLVTTIGTLVHWQTLALIMCSPAIIALAMIFFWPESPLWLIYKGEVDQSRKAFTWLRGTEEDAKKELQVLIAAQTKKVGATNKNKTIFQGLCSKIKTKDFYKPSLHMILILTNFYIMGITCLLTYSKDVMEIATGNGKAAMFWFLMIDTTFFLGAAMSLIFLRYFNTKTLFFIGSACNLCTLGMSLVSYLQHLDVISKDSLIFCYLHYSYFLFCHSGLSTVTFTVAIELMPVKHRGLGGTLYNVMTSILTFSTVKLFPYMIISMTLWGTLLLFSISGSVCTLLIWRYVPETKGRTLQEIEDYYNYGSFDIKKVSDDNMDVTILITNKKEDENHHF